jgi:hypothetical protein
MNMADVAPYARAPQVEVCAVPADKVMLIWDRVQGWISDALEASVMHEMPIDEVYTGCRDGTYLMLVMRVDGDWRGCAVLAQSSDPQGRPYLGLICCGGEGVHEWISILVTTCRLIAVQQGAREIVVMGRPGWRKLLQPFGLRVRAVVMVLDMERERDG